MTIELSNMSDSPVNLYPGEGIVQVEFERLDQEPEEDYSQKSGIYQGQKAVTPPRVRE